MRRAIVVALAFAALPAFAGITCTVTTRSTTGEYVAVTRVKQSLQDSSARLDFLEDSSGLAGTYLILRDGGKSSAHVLPSEKAFVEWQPPGAPGADSSFAEAVTTKVNEPKLEKLLDEDGGMVAGHRTRHLRFRTTYTVTINAQESHTTSFVIEDEIWVTQDLEDSAIKYWLAPESKQSSDANANLLVAAELSKMNGLPVKRITVNTSIEEDGVSETTRTEMTVTELKQRAVPGSTFEIPRGYKKKEAQPKPPASN